MFINISNHPSGEWSARQREAAHELGGEIVDEPYPAVPPEATPEEVAQMGATLLERLISPATTAVMVQGEFTLAFLLVSGLKSRGIACYAATTRRRSEPAKLEDGTTHKVSRFDFVQFRRYW